MLTQMHTYIYIPSVVGKVPSLEKQENGVPQILGCDVVHNTVRNIR